MLKLLRHAVFLALACVGAAAFAQDAFPSRSVRIVVPWPPSGPPDIVARLVAPRLGELWGKPVIVENRAGATGTIGTDWVARSPADGYTVLLTSNQPLVIAPAMMRVPYDPAKDLAPVAMVGQSVITLVVNPSLGINSVAELIAYAKAKPGALTYATSGVGSLGHLGGELVKQIAGIDMVHVPYQGAAPAVTAVIAGEVAVGFPPIQQAVPLVKSGKLRALGVAAMQPSQFLPDVPTLVSQGLGGVVVTTWIGAFAAPKTPRATVQVLKDGLQKALQDPGIRQKLVDAGVEPVWQEPDQLAAALESDLARWRKVIATAKITAN